MKFTKILCLVLALLMLAGCGVQPDPTVQTTAPTAEQPTTPATEPTSFQDLLLITEPYSEPQSDAEILAYRRDLVEAEMRMITSMYWTPKEDIVYNLSLDTNGGHSTEAVTLKAGVIYQGMPYTHGGGSGFAFLAYATEQDHRGVYTLDPINGALMSGQTGTARIGNDCADSVWWGWSRVSTSITFDTTKYMTEQYGNVVKVGDYQCDAIIYDSTTTKVIEDNGEDRMLACYAQLQKGDGIVHYTNGGDGHAVMVSDVHVVMDGDKIDPNNSYVTVLDQNYYDTAYYDEYIGETVHRLCGVDSKWTFEHLLQKGYLPITCKELIDPSPLPAETVEDSQTEHSFESLLTGTITTSFPISTVTITITDAEGKTVQQCTAYQKQKTDRYKFNMNTFTSATERMLMNGSVNPSELTAGQYRCVVTTQISTGRTMTARDFTFTVS